MNLLGAVMRHQELLDFLIVFGRDLHAVIDHSIHRFRPILSVLVGSRYLINGVTRRAMLFE